MKKKNIFKKIFYTLIVALLALVVAFFIYVNDYYKADSTATRIANSNEVKVEKDKIELLAKDNSKEVGIIFYPGAKVEYTSYLPLLTQLQNSGYSVISLKMPFNMAIFGKNSADDVYKDYPNIKHWYIMGHSMGGAMASSYAATHQDKIEGLILLGAYPYGDYPTSKTLTIYGSLNTSVAEKIDYSENVVVIDGGNHAQFGNYGKQRGDADALINAEKQQNEAATAIEEFIK